LTAVLVSATPTSITPSDASSVSVLPSLRTVLLYCSGVEAYCVYKNSRSFKNYNMYLAQLAAYEAAGADAFPYRPRYYYAVVNPLAAFETECSPKG
jgi:hypothetical protein